MVLKMWSQASSISIPWELLDEEIIRPHPRLTEPETLGWGSNPVLTKPCRWFLCMIKVENHISNTSELLKLAMPSPGPTPIKSESLRNGSLTSGQISTPQVVHHCVRDPLFTRENRANWLHSKINPPSTGWFHSRTRFFYFSHERLS